MTHRSLCCMPIVTLLIGLLVLSIGFNYVLLEKIHQLNCSINDVTSPVNDNELKEMMEEVKRLSKKTYTSDSQYDTRTKQPIKNDF